ncbi:MAG TPA: hypothetical protein DCE41_35245 [Cytophagales bacterium]|nr:hypothetical protein [Cytophagales bacterium]HAA18589.1 hypothetical protein [Cytophagales bacterium]HAP60389.1 hypothetical protein [Cytophagales bacterium]
MSQKLQLEKALHQNHWVVVSKDGNATWWQEECWQLASAKGSFQDTLYLYFLRDPQDLNRVWSIKAVHAPLADWKDEQFVISSLGLTSRHFQERMESLIADLERYRKTKLG